MKTISTVALLLSIGTVFGACASSEHEVMTPAARVTAPAVSPMSAVDQIAAARCDREARCNDIGATKEFQNREHCLQVMRADAADDLGDDDCPNGIGQGDLQECLSDIGTEDCGGVSVPFDKLETVMSCRQDDLCLD
jgi:hypothetical protein